MTKETKLTYLSPKTTLFFLQGVKVVCSSTQTEGFEYDATNPDDNYQW